MREFGQLEGAIMDVIWSGNRPYSVREVRERPSRPAPQPYYSFLTSPKTSSRRLARLGSTARTRAVSAGSTGAAATPGPGPRSIRTVPIGSTSMLRPTPVGTPVSGSAGSGTCPA
jgi:hypothetical protein